MRTYVNPEIDRLVHGRIHALLLPSVCSSHGLCIYNYVISIVNQGKSKGYAFITFFDERAVSRILSEPQIVAGVEVSKQTNIDTHTTMALSTGGLQTRADQRLKIYIFRPPSFWDPLQN